MRKNTLILAVFLFAVSCRKEDKYLILPQAASLYHADTGRGPDARHYSLVLKSTPSFITFTSPVLYPDGHYELSVANPYHINPGNAELFLYDSLDATVDQFTVNIPAPESSKKEVLKKISFSGGKYIGEMTIRYSPVNN